MRKALWVHSIWVHSHPENRQNIMLMNWLQVL